MFAVMYIGITIAVVAAFVGVFALAYFGITGIVDFVVRKLNKQKDFGYIYKG